MSKEKELKNIPGLKPEDVVVIRKLSYGEQSELIEKSVDADASGAMSGRAVKGQPQIKASISLGKFRVWLLVYGIREFRTENPQLKAWNLLAAKPNSPEVISQKLTIINKLESETGAHLFEQLNGFNNPLDDQAKKE